MTRKEGHTGIINIRLKEKKKKEEKKRREEEGEEKKSHCRAAAAARIQTYLGECGHRRATRAATSLLREHKGGGTGAWGPPKLPGGGGGRLRGAARGRGPRAPGPAAARTS